MLIGAGQLVEQRSLAAVLVACQRKGQRGLLRQRMLIFLDMKPAALTQTGMLTVKAARRRGGRPSDSIYRCDLDLPGVRQPKRQLIAVYPQLHGVAHGREFYQRHLRAGDQAHVQKMLAQGALSAHCRDPGRLADLQLVQHHFSLLHYHHICILPLWICPFSQCKCIVIRRYRQDVFHGKTGGKSSSFRPL